jgi:spore coat protein CotH
MARSRAWMIALVVVAACGGGGTAGQDGPGGDGGPPDAMPGPPPGDVVFAPDVLHVISIEVDALYLDQLENDRENRVPCTFTFDGTVVTQVGIRQKGGYGSSSNLDGKPAFSLKFNELVPGQRLDGLKKLWLNNAQEDPTFLSETMGYMTYRHENLYGNRTAHAVVSLNGFTYGIYVLVEPVGDDFFDRNFGPANDQGNLYEGFYHPADQSLGDFAQHPEELDLKDEVSEMRTREDINAFAAVVRDTPDAQFAAAVGAHMNLDRYITELAIDTFLGYWDSCAYFDNNYYLYHHPTEGFIYLPHGMDQLGYNRLGSPMSLFANRIRDIPELSAQLDNELDRLQSTWDPAPFLARIDQVEAILATSPPDPRVDGDRGSFDGYVNQVRDSINSLGP